MFKYFEFMSNDQEITYFEFRIIEMPDGSQIIDSSIITPMDALTPEMQEEYMHVHENLAYMERMRKKERREEERQRKQAKNPLWKLACLCGMV